MSIIYQPTEAEADLIAKEAIVLKIGEATHHLASVAASCHCAFWALPTDRLLAVLNHDVMNTLTTFDESSRLNLQVNASLDALGVERFTARAPTSAGRSDIIFNGEKFVYVPPDTAEQLPVIEGEVGSEKP